MFFTFWVCIYVCLCVFFLCTSAWLYSYLNYGNLIVSLSGLQTMSAHSFLNLISFVIRVENFLCNKGGKWIYILSLERNLYSKTFKLAKGSLSSSQLFVTSLHTNKYDCHGTLLHIGARTSNNERFTASKNLMLKSFSWISSFIERNILIIEVKV